MPKIKAHDLRTKKKDELLKQLEELKTELATLRVQKVTGGNPAKLAKIREVRKVIARVLTVINQTQRHQLRLFYSGKKYKPLDLRPKKTRAIRRRLTAGEAGAKTERSKKRAAHWPQRKYAIKSS